MQLNELKRDPSRPLNDVRVSTTSHSRRASEFLHHMQEEELQQKKWYHFCYDKQTRTCCDRNFRSWVLILAYSIFYLIFLSTYTLLLLYISLHIVKTSKAYDSPEHETLLISSVYNRLGLTATPTAVSKMSLISYRDGESSDYNKYVAALEDVISKRQWNVETLGPCGAAPFGYGSAPCVIIRINKHYGSARLALKPPGNSSHLPPDVKRLSTQSPKLWLHCKGNNPYDAEHIGKIKYFPDPPGFEPGLYVPGKDSNMSLVAVQFFNFTKGISLAVQCSVYYEEGISTVDFVLYVGSTRKLQ